MGLPKILMLALLVVWNASYLEADNQERDLRSAVSYVFCDRFNPAPVSFDVSVQPKSQPQEPTKPRLTASFSGITTKEFLSGTIDQLRGVQNVRITSTSMSEICFQSLVVDTTIVIDKETQFKASCESPTNSGNDRPCNNFGSDLTPVFVCPQAMTNLLKSKGIIANSPAAENPDNGAGKPPVYDITDDMAQASFVIADGVAEGSRLAVKYRASRNYRKITRGVESFNSFMKALGPVLNSFGGVTSIMTTFLTPNPFDELANYMKTQFDIVQRQLRDIQNDIENLQLVVESQSQKIAMATALRTIRHVTRSYNRMLTALSRYPVCDTKVLLKQSEVKSFMKKVQRKDLRNHLQDLLDVEFGGVLEASTGLLKPLMRAYCVSDPSRVTRFMRHISMYAYGGTLALFTQENLVCLKNQRKNCADVGEDKNDWLNKLYKFTMKAKVYRTAVTDPVKGLELDMKDDLKKIINSEVKKVPNPSPTSDNPFPGVFEKVNQFIINKLYNTHDWPYTCVVSQNTDKVLIFGVAQTNAKIFGTGFKPWALFNKAKLQNVKYKVKEATDRYTKKRFVMENTGLGNLMKVVRKNGGDESFFGCSNGACVFKPWRLNGVPPDASSNDRILYFMFNPMNFKTKAGTRKVIANMVPIDVYFASKSAVTSLGHGEIVIGCWEARKQTSYMEGWPRAYRCRAPDPNNVNREMSSEERYIAMIGE